MSDTAYTHIVVAIGLLEEADLITERAVAMARCNQATLSVLHVVEDLPLDPTGDSLLVASISVDPDVVNRSEQMLQHYCSRLDYPARAVVKLGNIQHELSQYIAAEDVDLVVVGSHLRSGLSALFGGKEDSIFHRAPCDVLAIRL